MEPEQAAILTLATYLAIAAALIVRSIRRCEDGLEVWFLYIVQRLYSGLMFRWRANNGPCPVPARGGGLIVVNHRSPVDPMMVWTNHHWRGAPDGRDRNIRVMGFLTAREYCEIRGLRWLTRTMQSIPVERRGQDMAATREAIRRLKEGRLVGIFPEGRINFGGPRLKAPIAGVGFLALRAQVPVYPVFLHDVPRPKKSMVEPFLTRSRVSVTYGEPIDLSAYQGRRKTPALLTEVANLIMSRLAETGGVDFTPAGIEPGRVPSREIA